MPKHVEQEKPESSSSSQAIKKSELKSLLAKCKSAQATIDEEKSSMGGLIADAVEHKNLHKKAFAWARLLDKMDAVKRAELLFHFDVYRQYLKWEQPDLLADRADPKRPGGGAPPGERPEEGDDDPAGNDDADREDGEEQEPGVGEEVLRTDAAGFPEDDKDVRPRFLRSGSAEPDPKLKH